MTSRKPHIWLQDGDWWVRVYGRDMTRWSPLLRCQNFLTARMYAAAHSLER